MYFYRTIRIFLSIIFRIIYKLDIEGLQNIPNKGRIILCSNHMSVLDPIILAIAVPRSISFMAKKELFKYKFLKKMLYLLNAFPVDRQGSDLSAIRSSLKVLKREKILGIFPEGTRRSEMDLENVKAGISLISIKSKSPIVPVFIDSKYRLFNRVKVRIGEPIDLNIYYDKKLKTEDHKKISKDILKSIYSLKS